MSLAKWIDHTLLKPDATEAAVRKVCLEAKEWKFFGVCLHSSWIPLAVQELSGSGVATVAVVGFPLGAMATDIKAKEAEWCVHAGAKEIDMVLHLGAMKEKNYSYVEKDIAAVAKACGTAQLKVILETGLLTLDEKRDACRIAVQAGAHFVKTCTGFNIGSATVEDIKLMREAVGPRFGVKASGGIKTSAQAMALIEAGANRLGTSSGVQLVQGQASSGGY